MNNFFARPDELACYLPMTDFDPVELVRHLLTGTPVNSENRPLRWPTARNMTVRTLWGLRLRVDIDGEACIALGQHVAATLLTRQLAPLLVALAEADGVSFEPTTKQLEAVHELLEQQMAPLMDVCVETFLKRTPCSRGFLGDHSFSTIEASLAWGTLGHRDASGLTLLKDLELNFGGKRYRGVVFREELAARTLLQPKAPRMYQVTMQLEELDPHPDLFELDAQSYRLAASAKLRLVYLPQKAASPEHAWRLLGSLGRTYDIKSAQLAESVADGVSSGAVPWSAFDGRGWAWLQQAELSEELRGKGLGVQLLWEQFYAATAELDPELPPLGHIMFSVTPMQFDYPTRGLTPELQVEAMDAVDRLRQHLVDSRFWSGHQQLENASVMLLPPRKGDLRSLERRLLSMLPDFGNDE